ncbi:MAG: hypothetical protein CL708_05045 [Chloroflexi bacterium]|nr:hypothetical protein [Chloroflexota bacterium]
MMTKDQNGKFKNIINYILVLLGINGVICILTTIFGLATDKRLLGSYDLSIISTINKLMWNIQFFSFWILVLGVVIGSIVAMIYTFFTENNS